MRDKELTPDMVPVIKLARAKNIPYSWISGYYPGLNFGRIADVIKGRRFPNIPPADQLRRVRRHYNLMHFLIRILDTWSRLHLHTGAGDKR